MSKVCAKHTLTRRDPQSTVQPLAICSVGLGYRQALPKAAGNKRYLLVGTDYFTKWVETKPLSNIRDVDAKKLVWKNIIT